MGDDQKFVWTASGKEESAKDVIPRLFRPELRTTFTDDPTAWAALAEHLREHYPHHLSPAVAAHCAAETCFYHAGEYKPTGRKATGLERQGYMWRDFAWLLSHDPLARVVAGTVWAEKR